MPDHNTEQSLGELWDSSGNEPPLVPGSTPPEPEPSQPPSQSPHQNIPEAEPPAEADMNRATLDYLAARGLDVSGYQSDDDWFGEAEKFEAYRQQNERELAEYRHNRAQFEEWRKSQSAPPEPTPEEKPAEVPDQRTPWQAPAVSETAWRLFDSGSLEVDPRTGLSKDPRLQPYLDEINQFQKFQREKAGLLFRDPQKFYEESGLFDRIKPQEIDTESLLAEAEKRVLEKIQAEQQKHKTFSQLEQARPLLYQTDASGRLIKNAADQPIPTELGKSFEEAFNYLHQTDPGLSQEQITNLALWHIRRDLESAKQKTETPAARREEQQETWLQRGKRNGTNRLSAEDTRISQAVLAAAQPESRGVRALSDLWDAAANTPE